MKILATLFILLFTGLSFGQECDLLTNTETYWPMPSIDKPEYLTPYIDAVFGTSITRIVGNPGDPIPNLSDYYWPSQQERHGYSKRQPWNCDQTMIFLDRCNNLFIDGETFDPLFIKTMPSNRVRWSHSEPHIMYYITSTYVGQWDVIMDTTKSIVSFSGYSSCTFGDGEGTFTWDDSKVAVAATRSSDRHRVIFIADMKTGTKGDDIDMSAYPVINNCTISPRGTYIVIVGKFSDDQTNADRIQVRYAVDTLGHKYGDIVWEETLYGVPSHFDTQIDQDGDEVIAGVAKSDYNGQDISGKVIKRKLFNGELSVICDHKYASHTSGRAIQRPGWVFVTYATRSIGYAPYINELVAVKLDGSKTKRICHLHAYHPEYVFESHGVPSPDGTRAMWASDWDTNTWPVQSYVADYRNGKVFCDRYTLKSSVDGNGTINVSDSLSYIENSKINIEATPVKGWIFGHWSGDLSGNENPTSIVLDSDKEIKATFVKVPDNDVITVIRSSDDAEEYENGSVHLSSGDLELLYDGTGAGQQTVGVRFDSIKVPQGSVIESAYISFTAKGNKQYDIIMKIQAEDIDNSPTFNDASSFNISSRTKTDSVYWKPAPWVDGNVYETPELSSIVQTVINRSGWRSGNAMSFIISFNGSDPSYTGKRVAYSYDGDITKAPVLHIKIDTTTAINHLQNNIPHEYSISNYPNPFNPTTTINFTVPNSGDVKIVIYDIRGREIAVLTNGFYVRGSYKLIWNAKDKNLKQLPSGMYIVRIQSGGFVKNKKMLLIR